MYHVRSKALAGPLALTVAAVVAGAIAAGTADAAPPPPPGDSAVAQYVEMIPTAGGGSASGASTGPSASIPAGLAKRINKAGKDASVLTRVVSSPALGAPPRGPWGRTEPRLPSTGSPNALAALSDVGSRGVVLGLFVAMGLILVATIAAAVTAGRRRAL